MKTELAKNVEAYESILKRNGEDLMIKGILDNPVITSEVDKYRRDKMKLSEYRIAKEQKIKEELAEGERRLVDLKKDD